MIIIIKIKIMNNIYIINNYFEKEIELNFKNNNFEKDNIYYNFIIIVF